MSRLNSDVHDILLRFDCQAILVSIARVAAKLADVLGLRGPLSADPTAHTPRAHLMGILERFGFRVLIIQRFFIARKLVLSGATVLVVAATSLYLLRPGSLQKAARI